MKRRTHLVVFGLILMASTVVFSQSAKPRLLTFADLQHYSPANETFRIEGYVLNTYKCPPCPPGAMCKPCIPDNITLVNSSDWSKISELKQLRVYTDLTDKFEAKKRYRVTVRVFGNINPGDPVDSVKLVSIEPAGRR
jgi:hypothetical protein